MYISLWENSRGHPDNVSFMQFSTKIDGFEQKDSQGFENSYNSLWTIPIRDIFIFTIYQNYTFALKKLLKNWAALPYILSVSVIRCKNEAVKKLHFKSIIKCFKRVKTDKWPDLPYSFPTRDCCVRINHKPDSLLHGDNWHCMSVLAVVLSIH